MPVIALSEVGLIIDVFGDKPKVVKSTKYQLNNNKVISYFGGMITFIDLRPNSKSEKMVNLCEMPLERVTDMKLSPNGQIACFLTANSKLTVVKLDWEMSRNYTIILEVLNVGKYGVSDRFVFYTNETKFNLFDIDQSKQTVKKEIKIKDVICLNKIVFVLTDKIPNQEQILYAIRDGKITKLIGFKEAHRIKAEYKRGGNESEIVLVIETSYSSKTYFADVSVYFLKIGEADGQNASKDNIDEVADGEKESKNSHQIIHKLVSRIEGYSIYFYETLHRVLQVKWLDNAFFVCFGSQPANLFLFDGKTGKSIKKFKKTIRNKICFSTNGNRIIYAGYGNLPGNVEVHDSGTVTCKFESLGASIFEWLNDNSHFMVATTNYFKSDNKIDIYDYYGRKTEQMECKSLVKAEVYGNPQPAVVLKEPEVLNVLQKQEAWVIPDFNLPENTINTSKNRIPKKKIVSKKVELTMESLVQEIEMVEALKEKQQGGEDLSIEDQNRIFTLPALYDQIAKFK